MGSGTISYRKLPKKKKVYGDKDFFIRPLTLGLNETYNAFIVRPADDKSGDGFVFEVEGEFSMSGSERLREVREEYADVDVKFVYMEIEKPLFSPKQLQQLLSFCDRAI